MPSPSAAGIDIVPAISLKVGIMDEKNFQKSIGEQLSTGKNLREDEKKFSS